MCRWWSIVVCAAVLALPVMRAARADDARSVGLLPIRSRWVPANQLAFVNDALLEVGSDVGLDVTVLDVDDSRCFHDDACYLRAAKAANVPFALALEVVRTSSARL